MGGQRSCAWLEGLVASPLTSALSFENIDPREYERLQPWRLQARPPTRAPAPRVAASLTPCATHAQNHTREYFEMVVRSGGVEGKFVQDVPVPLPRARHRAGGGGGADGDPDGEGAGGG